MRRNLFAVALTTLTTLGILTQATPAAAQSTNAPPVIETFGALDPAKLPWITPAQQTDAASLIADYGAGRLAHFVIVASPRGAYITRSSFPASTGVAEIARQALESCEYVEESSCYMLSVDGLSSERPSGGWAAQPAMLLGNGGRFDHTRVPFAPDADRANLRAYGRAAKPKVMMLSNSGYWAYRSGATVAEALAETTTACEGEPKARTCFLYAVDDFVVFAPVN